MQVTLNFQFPSQTKEISVCANIISPELQPKSVMNFIFMCTGNIPSPELLQLLQISTENLNCVNSTAGLRTFAESSVIRIEKGVMMEIGSSTTKTIFGGFIPDESSKTISSSSLSLLQNTEEIKKNKNMLNPLCAGTILIGNVGMPNSNGSRYYILLQDITSPAQQEELSIYQSLGIIINGIDKLREFCGNVAVQSRTLAPVRPVRMWASDLQLINTNINNNINNNKREKLPRIAGRVRRRDEDEDINNNNIDDTNIETNKFFDPSRSFPESINNSSAPQAKRFRSENNNNNGESINPPTTAIPPEEGKTFDFFAAQEAVFMQDVANIAETQAIRRNRNNNNNSRNHKKKIGGVGNTKINNNLGGKSKRVGGGSQNTVNGVGSTKKKVLQRRY